MDEPPRGSAPGRIEAPEEHRAQARVDAQHVTRPRETRRRRAQRDERALADLHGPAVDDGCSNAQHETRAGRSDLRIGQDLAGEERVRVPQGAMRERTPLDRSETEPGEREPDRERGCEENNDGPPPRGDDEGQRCRKHRSKHRGTEHAGQHDTGRQRARDNEEARGADRRPVHVRP